MTSGVDFHVIDRGRMSRGANQFQLWGRSGSPGQPDVHMLLGRIAISSSQREQGPHSLDQCQTLQVRLVVCWQPSQCLVGALGRGLPMLEGQERIGQRQPHQGVRVWRWASKGLARPITNPHQALE